MRPVVGASQLDPTVRRAIASAGRLGVYESTDLPPSGVQGDVIIESDTGVLRVWVDGVWVAPVAVWA